MANLPCVACQATVDYRNAPSGTPLFPYTMALDATSSILHPGEGQRQRFCYQVTPVPSSTTVLIPLESFILGIPTFLTADDIYSLAVTVNGDSQTVVWGENAALVSSCAGGCAGLRLAFPLVNATDSLTFCLTLNRVFGVGPIPVCLFGNGESASGLSICGPALSLVDACPTTARQEVDVCVPITITPYATVGDAMITCCGDPVITGGTAACSGIPGGSCSFTVSQRVCVSIPVQFGASTASGSYAVRCGDAGEGTCENCAGTGNAAGQTAAFSYPARTGTQSVNSASSTCGCAARRSVEKQTSISDVLRWIDR